MRTSGDAASSSARGGWGTGQAVGARLAGGTIDYSVDPSVVECSRRNGPGHAVSLTVHAFNHGPEPVACRLISIGIPFGGGGTALTADPSSIRPAPGRETPWHVGVAGDGEWDCFPLPPQTSIAPMRRVSFVLSNLVVNTVPDQDGARVRIREFHGHEFREVELRVVKTPAAGAESDLAPEAV